MKIVTAIDSFKGSMTSMEAGQAAAEGIQRVDVDAEVIVRFFCLQPARCLMTMSPIVRSRRRML